MKIPPLELPLKNPRNEKHICRKSGADVVPKHCDKCHVKERKTDIKRPCTKNCKIKDQSNKKEEKANSKIEEKEKKPEKEIVVLRVKCECSEQGLEHTTPGYDCTPNRIKSILKACEGSEKLNKQILRTNGLVKQNDKI